jgi:hypothetical protein
LVTELIEFEGHEYCPIHLPLGSPKKFSNIDFLNKVTLLAHHGHNDFSFAAIPGGPNGTTVTYGQLRAGHYRRCDVGASAQIYHDGGDVDWSGSTFHGNTIIVPNGHFSCKDAIFEHHVEFHFGGAIDKNVDFAGSIFKSSSRFDSLARQKLIRFDKCRFSAAPAFTSSSPLTQQTSFTNAHFVARAEDEGAYRAIRILFSDNRARESEGQFYALEKRCHRLQLPWLRSGITRIISWLYDVTAEYGQSYGRALLWFCAVQLVFCVGYAVALGRFEFGGELDGPVVAFAFAQVVKPFELFSGRAGGATLLRLMPAGPSGWWMFWTAVQSVASLGLATLFLLALRWRFRRE